MHLITYLGLPASALVCGLLGAVVITPNTSTLEAPFFPHSHLAISPFDNPLERKKSINFRHKEAEIYAREASFGVTDL